LARIDVVREALRQRGDVVEVQIQYANGEVTSFQVDEQSGASAAEQLETFLGSVDWDRVKEVELEYANEEEHEIDFEELEDDDDEDEDDEDDEGSDEERVEDDPEDDDDEDDPDED